MNQDSHDTPKKKRTVGQEALDIFQKGDKEHSPIELQREMTRDYYQNLIDCALEHRRKIAGRFFIVVITKNEKLLPNVMRNYFFARTTCPTPEYDQSVFKYNHRTEEIEYLWTVPSQDACIYLSRHIKEVVPDEHQLLGFVLEFYNGALFKKAKKLNSEKEKTPLLELKEMIA